MKYNHISILEVKETLISSSFICADSPKEDLNKKKYFSNIVINETPRRETNNT